jgi:hypothetical protein
MQGKDIIFLSEFNQAPTVVAFITGLQVDCGQSKLICVKVIIDSIKISRFTLSLDAWGSKSLSRSWPAIFILSTNMA